MNPRLILAVLAAALALQSNAFGQTSTPQPGAPSGDSPSLPSPSDGDGSGKAQGGTMRPGFPTGATFSSPLEAEAAEAAAGAWLGLLDAGQYSRSWETASGLLQSKVSRDDWIQGLSAKRAPYGAVVTRTLRGIEPTTSMPDAPIGQYMSMHYATHFAHGPEGLIEEIVTCLQDANGHWFVTGYGVK